MKKLSLTLGLFLLPVFTFAQQLENVDNLVSSVGDIINKIIPIMFTIALLGFFYGLVKYIFGDQDREAAKKTMVWGVVALFVMAAVWGLVNFIGDAVGIDRDSAPDVGNLIPTP